MNKETWRRVERSAVFVFGVLFITLLLVLAIFISKPTVFQYEVFKTVLALACAGVAAFVPGFLTVEVNRWIRAGGAIGVFVLIYIFSPAQLVAENPYAGLLSEHQVDLFTQNLSKIEELKSEYQRLQEEYIAQSKGFNVQDSLIPLVEEMDAISQQMNGLIEQNDILLNGKKHLSEQVQKLQTTIHVMTLTKDIWRAIVDVYSDSGNKSELLDYLESTGCLTDELEAAITFISFSKTEIEFTKALGCIGFDKKIKKISLADIEAAKAGLKQLGYLSSEAEFESNKVILDRFHTELRKHFTRLELNEPIYELASAGFKKQGLFYVSFYESGLIDFSSFMAATVPEGRKKWVKQLLAAEFDPFDLQDFDELFGVMTSYYPPLLTNNMQSNLLNLRSEYQKFIETNRMDSLLSTSKVADYFVEEMKRRFTDDSLPENDALDAPTLNLEYVNLMQRILSIQTEAIEQIDFTNQPRPSFS